MNETNPAELVPYVTAAAFALAFVFGAVGNRTGFCTMGAVSDWVNMGDTGRMRMWLLAIAVALLGSSALDLTGLVDLSRSIYAGPNLAWLSHLVGGFLFGVGMTLGSGCGAKTLIRIGGGNLKSLVVYVFLGISAYMTLRGLFGAFRVGVLDRATIVLPAGQDLPSLLTAATTVGRGAWTAGLATLLGAGLIAYVYASREFRASFDHTLGGVVTGLVVAGGWYVSGVLGHVAEDPATLQEAFVATNSGRMESLSFVAPVAYTLEYLMLWTDKSRIVTYGIASALGVIAGSAAYALVTGTFRWEGFRDAADTGNHVVGGILMGFGGITALGCTIGQGISGISTLALGSFLTFGAIIAGSALTMKYQVLEAYAGALARASSGATGGRVPPRSSIRDKEKDNMASRFSLALAAAAVCATLVAPTAHAQGSYPNRPIRILTPFAAGGGSDILARLIGPQLTERLGQPIIVDNRPGGAGTIGAGIAQRAEPDGYTVIIVSGTYGATGALYKLPYDTVTGIQPIILIGTTGLVLAVHPSVPVKTLPEFIAHAKANPNKLNFGSAGVGDLGHLAGELLKLQTGISMTQVPYKGSGPLMTAIISGEVPVSMSSIVPTIPHVKAGRMRPIAVTIPKRSRALPNTPSFADTVPGYEVTHWYGMWGPRGLPPAIVRTLNEEIARILRTDAMQKWFEREGMESAGGPPDEFRDRIKADLEKWRRVVKEAKINIGT